VLRGRIEQDPDAPAGVWQVAVAPAEQQGLPAVGRRQADKHPHRGGCAGAVGAEETRDGPPLAAERDIGDDCATAAPLGEFVDPDHERRLATRTIAALTAMIDRRPTHCSASPMPSPQYGFEGPTSTGRK
jgi:hypothetical protein